MSRLPAAVAPMVGMCAPRASRDPFQTLRNVEPARLLDPMYYAFFNTFLAKAKTQEDLALAAVDAEVGQLAALVHNVTACCAATAGRPAKYHLGCTALLTAQYGKIGEAYMRAVQQYFAAYANVTGVRDTMCKLYSIGPATKPLKDTATAISVLSGQLMNNTCVAGLHVTLPMIGGLASGLASAPEKIASLLTSAAGTLWEFICRK